MCYCKNSFLPSIYCNICGELYCFACSDEKILKCDNCEIFYCVDCGIKPHCEHNYCSLDCAYEKNNKCYEKCLFFRDMCVKDTDKMDIIKYWIEKTSNNIVDKWLEEYNK